jgi:hypothetical protein
MKSLIEQLRQRQYFFLAFFCKRSSIGVRRIITNRLNTLRTAKEQKKDDLIKEINEQIWYLHSRYRESQQKLDEIRTALEN